MDSKVCKQCGENKTIDNFYHQKGSKDGWAYKCKSCQSKNAIAWNIANPDKYKRNRHNFSIKHSKEIVKRVILWQNANRTKKNETNRRWATSNREKIFTRAKYIQEIKNLIDPEGEKKKRAEKRSKNKTGIKNSHQKWAKAHPDKINTWTHKHRSKNRGRDGSFTTDEWNWLLGLCGNKCLCPCDLCDNSITIDHIDPNGTNFIENLQPLCKPCNSAKCNRNTIDYRPRNIVENFAELKRVAGF